ncbi:MAG: uroporphyrinogen-III synthase [Elusimicrobia bacterium]|nr:uroporphyrinogen-III synthase [Elusimicrobiota bacterium]MDE2426365.1 uroporphyrinogen-III synthase [Elusimicrobiota bacterium]
MGKRRWLVVVTRPREQASGLVRRLRRGGARVVCAPTIRIAPPSSYAGLDLALRRLARWDCAVFTSANAIEAFFGRARALGLPRPRPTKRCFAIGPATAAALRRRGWRPRVPAVSRGEALAAAIAPRPGERVLIARAQDARPGLVERLRARGALVRVARAYRNLSDAGSAAALRALADAGNIDAVAFTSGSTAQRLRGQLGQARFKRLFADGSALAASIGPVTSAALRRLGARRLAQARSASERDLAQALLRRLRERGGARTRARAR